jgi:hypothetical protein
MSGGTPDQIDDRGVRGERFDNRPCHAQASNGMCCQLQRYKLPGDAMNAEAVSLVFAGQITGAADREPPRFPPDGEVRLIALRDGTGSDRGGGTGEFVERVAGIADQPPDIIRPQDLV